jgi:7-cyano-7-deazaguanine synthase in queuosine biosynthesis
VREVLVACGDVPAPRSRGRQLLVLDVDAGNGGARRVNLRVERITRAMVAALPDRVADLLEIACYVYCADQLSRREGATMPRMGEDWRRGFRFTIAVRDPDFWGSAEVSSSLSAALGFLSEDRYEFSFVRTGRRAGSQGFLDLRGDGPDPGFRPERVILFSGGLDSFAGAAEALLRDKVPAVLVSHHASNLVRRVQLDLAQALRQRAGASRLLHVSVRINKGIGEAVEFTQRSRAFLFASIGLAVARALGRSRVSFYENGVVSLNLPLAGHVLGARATRTTHPRTLRDLGQLFSALADQDVRIENPFLWLTKAEVVRRIADAGCAPLIERTFSCAHVREATRLGGRHCGVCSQCLDRRFGVLAADCGGFEPSTLYGVDLFRGARESGAEVTMAEAYVLAAHRHARSGEAEFLGAHGEIFRALPYLDLPPAEAASRLHHLHVRHGQQVVGVVDRQRSSCDAITDRLELPDTSLLAMIMAPAARDIELEDPVGSGPPGLQGALSGGARAASRPLRFAVDAATRQVHFEGGIAIGGEGFRLVAKLLPNFLAGQASGRGEEAFAFEKTRTLAGALGVTEETLRAQVSRFRRASAERFKAVSGVDLTDGDVVENRRWAGYRLNPHLLLDATLLVPDARAQVSRLPPGASQLSPAGWQDQRVTAGARHVFRVPVHILLRSQRRD